MKIVRYLSCGVVALSLMGLAAPAVAHTHTVLTEHYKNGGAYMNIHAGQVKPTTKSFRDVDVESNYFYKLNSDRGYKVGAAMGYRKCNYRTEFAIGHQSSSLDSFSGNFPPYDFLSISAGSAGMDGRVKATTFMWNGYYDFTNYTCFVPYIGVGIGVAHIQHDLSYQSERKYFAQGSDTVFAYQGIIGISAEIATNWRASIDYRYLNTARGKFQVIVIGSTTPFFNAKGRHASHQVNLGLTYFIS